MAGIKNVIGGTFEDVSEAVVKPIQDEVGQAIEQGVQSVTGKTPLPQDDSQSNAFSPEELQSKKLEDQKKLKEAQYKIQWWKKLDEQQRSVREMQRQKNEQRLQVIAQEQKKKEEVKQFQLVEKKQKLNESQARSQAERKAGRGVGG